MLVKTDSHFLPRVELEQDVTKLECLRFGSILATPFDQFCHILSRNIQHEYINGKIHTPTNGNEGTYTSLEVRGLDGIGKSIQIIENVQVTLLSW